MERPKRPFSLFKRPSVRARHIYYCRFRDPEGRYLSPISTGNQARPPR